MTTTGAAKHQGILQLIQPKIVIIEEAAEVLEAHIVTSLSMGCEHLILIGDHHQLRPNPAVYQLAVRYNLEISLFERLVANGFEHAQLRVQHRMCPEIADTLMPFFYDNLQNDCSVSSYPSIKGVEKNMFFINHTEPETTELENHSKKNIYEAEFAMALARYLIQQEYEPEQITILTTYTAQMFHIQSAITRTKDGQLGKVKTTVVDNFQGEENDIIILSLVRSNEEGKIGFLKIKNRVCVALSRAKMGFYCIGNFGQLAEQCDFWSNIIEALQKKNAIGRYLTLICQQHSTSSKIEHPRAFARLAPDGGCSKLCSYRMDCGHSCKLFCHALSHDQIRCPEICGKKCGEGHECHRQCDLCQPTCRPCQVLRTKQLHCGHSRLVDCGIDVSSVPCFEKCNVELGCGHLCLQSCSQPHICRCHVPTIKNRSCGHPIDVKCYEDPDTFGCEVEITKTWPVCGHTILVPCSVELGAGENGLVPSDVCCIVSVAKVRSCGHTVFVACSKSAETVACVADTQKIWPCCGHEKKIACNMPVGLSPCLHPCEKVLRCGHTCKGSCGACRNGRLHIACQDKCSRRLLCGHACKSPCFKACRPCKNICPTKCSHSECSTTNRKQPASKCGEHCRVCEEPCDWKCKHLECVRKCSEPCSRAHCQEPCENLLPSCGHLCMGLCGEECPDVCQVCEPDYVDKLGAQLGSKLGDKTALIKLHGCGHIFHSSGLDRYVDSKLIEAGVLVCPTIGCNNPIQYPGAYGQNVKLRLQQIESAKRRIKWSSSSENLKHRTRAIFVTMSSLRQTYGTSAADIAEIVQGIFKSLQQKHQTDENLCGFTNVLDVLQKADEILHRNRFGALLPTASFSACPRWKAALEKWCQIAHDSVAHDSGTPTTVSANTSLSERLQGYIENQTKSLIAWLKVNFKAVSPEVVQDCILELHRLGLLISFVRLVAAALRKMQDLSTEQEEKMSDFSRKLLSGSPLCAADIEALVTIGDDVAATILDTNAWKTPLPILTPQVPHSFDANSWRICVSGHIYLVGRCEEMMVGSSSCRECIDKAGAVGTNVASRDTLMPLFGDNLQSDSIVSSNPSTKGMEKCMYFVSHDEHETVDDASRSHKNVFEVEFTVALARYLTQQKYEPDQITILTTCTGQMLHLRAALKEDDNSPVSNIKCACVDNFQGKENDIIILSLVRSNMEGKIGYLTIKHRISVALAKARQGFYCFGKFGQLAERCVLWNGMADVLKQKQMIGRSLRLKCQNHSAVTKIEHPRDFARLAPDGGCDKACSSLLDCGHACKLSCHVLSHDQVRCLDVCGKKCPQGHECDRRCWFCQPPCSSCMVVCTKQLVCGHTRQARCSEDLSNFHCNQKCNSDLECGHPCPEACSPKHICGFHLPVAKVRSCGHSIEVECSQDPELVDCAVMVTKTWPQCGHDILVPCSTNLEVTEESLAKGDIRCKVYVAEVRSCGHSFMRECSKSAEPDECETESGSPDCPDCMEEKADNAGTAV